MVYAPAILLSCICVSAAVARRRVPLPEEEEEVTNDEDKRRAGSTSGLNVRDLNVRSSKDDAAKDVWLMLRMFAEVEMFNEIQAGMVNQQAANKRPAVLDGVRRMIPVPAHRYSPLKENWVKIFTLLTELKLRIRFHENIMNVEISTPPETPDKSSLQKATDFIKAFLCGFEVEDASMLLAGLDDLFVEASEVKDASQRIKGHHQSRTISRLVGKGGRRKQRIEKLTRTKIVLQDTKLFILGSYQNIQLVRNAIGKLILGIPPSKVYRQL
ncbi:PREDICTED: RNA-binding protein pno1-like [Vollenhovia emeryi]|uniref:RNA-binding protein pno1-like n=1 Tax=Vollenhovia emeryi TaxID=411798 RepID=UPI0005F57BA5|nr:PREDICTED: RNA-binding protein pno1-like [Vollenhovia emeryi]